MRRPERSELESLWHHTDYNISVSIQHNRFSEYVAIPRKSPLPQSVAQYDFAVRALFVLSFHKQTPKCRLDSEHGKETLCHLQARHVFGRIDTSKVGRPVVRCAHRLKRTTLVPPVDVLRSRNRIFTIH